MTDPTVWLTVSGAGLIGLCVVAWAALNGWRGWLELERLKLQQRAAGSAPEPGASPSPAARIELADLKERVRKLEAIAAGVDL